MKKKVAVILVFILGLSLFSPAFSEKTIKVGDYVKFGHYPQSSSSKTEEIEWLVLDVQDGKALLISHYGLDAGQYHNEKTDITWENCLLRYRLNGNFMLDAFTKDERKAILTTHNDNSKEQMDPKFESEGGKETQDYAFLLSYKEVLKYFGARSDDEKNQKARATITRYAESHGSYTNKDYLTTDGHYTAKWWLRSSGWYQNMASMVDVDGSLKNTSVINDSCCIRPAIWVDLNSGYFN